MYGTRQRFHYVHCQGCDALYQPQRLDDYSPYYPGHYYSFSAIAAGGIANRIRVWLKTCKERYYYLESDFLGKFLARRRPRPATHVASHVDLKVNDSILDVGCGGGNRVREMSKVGFGNLLGIDPFIGGDLSIAPGCEIWKTSINELQTLLRARRPELAVSGFDLIMFNHSFEHVMNPESDLAAAATLLSTGGKILLRIPVSDSHAFRTYGVHWVQLDAPRHVFLLSSRAIELLATRCGLRVTQCLHDSTAFQFWGSEQYRLGIPMRSTTACNTSIFTDEQMAMQETKAQDLNRAGLGDQAGFVLERK